VLPLFGADPSSNALCRRLDINPTVVQTDGRAETPFTLLRQIADPQIRLASFREYGKPSLSAFVSVPVLDDMRQKTDGRHYDLVHIARAYLLAAIDVWPKGERPIVSVDLDEDDVRTQQSIAMLHHRRGDADAGDWYEAEAAAFARLMEQRLADADFAFVSTNLDRQSLRLRRPDSNLIIAENAVAILPVTIREGPGAELLFVGGFGYFPNFDAASWILDTIWPRLTASCPDRPSLTIVGRSSPPALRKRAESLGVILLDDIEDLAPLYALANIALVPVRAGGGSRIKLLEAAAHGVPVVATTIGAEGTHMRDGEDLWLADTPEAMVDAIMDVLRSPAEATRRAANARASVEKYHSRQASISTLSRQFARAAGAVQGRWST
jgi:glycosyltransferase involved in cell wall biosynthesis